MYYIKNNFFQRLGQLPADCKMPVVSKYKYQSPQPMDKCIREHGQRFETDWTCERHLNSCHIFHLEIIYTCSNLTKISIDKKQKNIFRKV